MKPRTARLMGGNAQMRNKNLKDIEKGTTISETGGDRGELRTHQTYREREGGDRIGCRKLASREEGQSLYSARKTHSKETTNGAHQCLRVIGLGRSEER